MVSFLDLKRINQRYSRQFKEVLDDILHNGQYILGSYCQKFERAFADYCGVKYALGVANGLEALELILLALREQGKISEGDDVIVPANTFIASILAITNAGLKPILVEPDESTFNINPDLISKNITARTRAVMAVHLYGSLSGIDRVKEVCDSHGLILIEDSAQAHGAELNGIRAGNWGLAAGFSFYPGKNLGAIGDGGMITTSDKELYQLLCAMRNYGSNVKYVNDVKGRNSRLDELQAGFLYHKLKELDAFNSNRIAVANRYQQEINNPHIKVSKLSNGLSHVYHLFVVRLNERDRFINHMEQNGIKVLIHYPIPPHKQAALRELHDYNLPITENIHKTIVSLPIDPLMASEDVDFVIRIVNGFK